MKHAPSVLIAAGILFCAPAPGAIVTFDPLITGTSYGQAQGNQPGDLILTESGVAVRIQKFKQVSGSESFSLVNVRANIGALPTKCLYSSNLNLEFDFTALPFAVNTVTLLFVDQGGIENLGVNGSALYSGEIVIAPASLGGATVAVTPQTMSTPGMVTITGAIQKITVGGQEFGLDTVTETPAPGGPIVAALVGLLAVGRRRRGPSSGRV